MIQQKPLVQVCCRCQLLLLLSQLHSVLPPEQEKAPHLLHSEVFSCHCMQLLLLLQCSCSNLPCWEYARQLLVLQSFCSC